MSNPLTEEQIRALHRGNKIVLAWKGMRNREKFIKESDASDEFIEFLDEKEPAMFVGLHETESDIFRFSSKKYSFIFHFRYLRDVYVMLESTPFGSLCDRIRAKYKNKNDEEV